MKKISLIAALIFLASCTHHNQYVGFDLRLDQTATNIGNGTKINLTVFDDRSAKNIVGSKQFSADETISILSKDDLALLLNKKISAVLEANGFKKGDDKIIEIHIQKFVYQAKREFFVGSSEAEAAIQVVVQDGKTKNKFIKNFSLSLNGKHFLAPLQSTDASTLNSLLQEITQDIVSNQELLKILAQ